MAVPHDSPAPEPQTTRGPRVPLHITAAAVLLLMGLGNIVYASSKSGQYSHLLSLASREAERPVTSRSIPMFHPLNIDEHSKYLNKLRSRIEFYEFVIDGGKCFIAAAALVLTLGMAGLLGHRPPRRQRKS